MLKYIAFLIISIAVFIVAYYPELKQYIKKVMENNHWNFPHHHHG
jgi:hypothetical protein